jgi:hypothetical protein
MGRVVIWTKQILSDLPIALQTLLGSEPGAWEFVAFTETESGTSKTGFVAVSTDARGLALVRRDGVTVWTRLTDEIAGNTAEALARVRNNRILPR